MGNREVPYYKYKECDICGKKGAHDFMGDYFCDKCVSYTDSDSVIQKIVEGADERKFEPQKENK